MDTLHSTPHPVDLISALVYSAQTSDVKDVVIDGQLVMRDGDLLTMDEAPVREDAERETRELLKRAGIDG
jgi:cytosine/adenosine deaminase-related metal-dependent hydrolase